MSQSLLPQTTIKYLQFASNSSRVLTYSWQCLVKPPDMDLNMHFLFGNTALQLTPLIIDEPITHASTSVVWCIFFGKSKSQFSLSKLGFLLDSNWFEIFSFNFLFLSDLLFTCSLTFSLVNSIFLLSLLAPFKYSLNTTLKYVVYLFFFDFRGKNKKNKFKRHIQDQV